MRIDSATMQVYRANPDSYHTEVLYLVTARNRSTGVKEVAGFWSGDRHRAFTVDGVSRLFYGGGSILDEPELVLESGLKIATVDLEFSPLTPEFTSVARVYDVRNQPFAIYEAYFDASTEKLIEPPIRVFKAMSDKLAIRDAEEGGQSSATLTIVSSARDLTRFLSAKHSDESLRLRSNDRIGRYTSVAGAIAIPWGRAS